MTQMADQMQDVQEQLGHWEGQLREAQTEADDAQAAHILATERDRAARTRLEALTKVVAGLKELVDAQGAPQSERLPILPVGAGDVGEEAPRGQEAVRRILAESGEPWRVKDLVDEVERRGWIDSHAKNKPAAVSIAVRRLLDADVVHRVGIGTYQIAATKRREHVAGLEGQEAGEKEENDRAVCTAVPLGS